MVAVFSCSVDVAEPARRARGLRSSRSAASSEGVVLMSEKLGDCGKKRRLALLEERVAELSLGQDALRRRLMRIDERMDAIANLTLRAVERTLDDTQERSRASRSPADASLETDLRPAEPATVPPQGAFGPVSAQEPSEGS
jgi:hypothetical protein